MRPILRWSLILLALLVLGAITVGLSFPLLATNAPCGARVAVVEGWIEAPYMPQVHALLAEGAYDTIYITGTPRNFSYTLRHGDTLVVELQRPVTGELLVNACGAKNAGMIMEGSHGTLLADSVFGPCIDRKATITVDTDRLRFTPTFNGHPDPHWELLFLNYVKLNGINLHALQRRVTIVRSNGDRQPGTPSFADAAAEHLIAAGTPAARILKLPTVLSGRSRTWANAQRFAQEARQRGIRRVDVISFGIHARRSRLTFAQACGSDVAVGVRCVEDPELQRGRWWHHPIGWTKVLRELAGVPASYLVDHTR